MPTELIFKYFAQSDNIAVWYELDEMLLTCEICDVIKTSVQQKYIKLVEEYETGQDTQLLKYVHTAACLKLKCEDLLVDEDKIENTQDLRLIKLMSIPENRLIQDWLSIQEEPYLQSTERAQVLYAALLQSCQDISIVSDAADKLSQLAFLGCYIGEFKKLARENLTFLIQTHDLSQEQAPRLH